ncbi:MAG: hypothetical protein J6Q72_02155 [Clostridia bacterium]|nr:hypothetical protein [Clostridia bacterium]
MNKRRISRVLLIASFAVILILCGTVLAYMFRQTEPIDNEFTPAHVSCKVVEEFDGVQKTSIKIQNTGNIESYLRVRLVSYWVDADGNIAPKPSKMPEIALASGWIKGENNTYYYQQPVAPNTLTETLLSAPIILEKDENGYMQVLDVFAEAIQSKPHSAVTDSWDVAIDSNGNIVSQ